MMNKKIATTEDIMKEIDYDFSGIKGMRWINPMNSKEVKIAGFPWIQKDGVYRRLPLEGREALRPPVDHLADQSAGGQLHLETDTKRLYIAVKLGGKGSMYHMPATGQCGFDIYINTDEGMRYYKTAGFDHTKDAYVSQMFQFQSNKMRTVALNFPLYQVTRHVLVGIDENAVAKPSGFLAPGKKAVFYGTSITQGGCATRPGMAYPNILSRMLKKECVNLGFSGNGKGDIEVAAYMAEMDATCYVLDHLVNCTAEEYKNTLVPFILKLKEAKPDVPVFVVSGLARASQNFVEDLHEDPVLAMNQARTMRRFILETIDSLERKGCRGLHFIDGQDLVGEAFEETTVDGVHPTDFGFYQMAKAMAPMIKHYI